MVKVMIKRWQDKVSKCHFIYILYIRCVNAYNRISVAVEVITLVKGTKYTTQADSHYRVVCFRVRISRPNTS